MNENERLAQAEEAYNTAINSVESADAMEKLIASMAAANDAREAREDWKRYVESENNKESEPKTKGGFATLCVLGAAALAVAVPYLINKFKKED